MLYSNLWIAGCALAMALQTQWLLTQRIVLTDLCWFILFSTWVLYALHRLTGLARLKAFSGEGRYSVIGRFRNHIILYALSGAVIGAWFFFQLEFRLQVHIAFTGIISLGYVLPVLGSGKRLRDIHFLKIFLIAITWSWVTVVLPALEAGVRWHIGLIMLIVERAVFLFAITLPFDIRDHQIDAHTGVKTIPGYIGMAATKKLSATCLLMAVLLAALNIGHVYLLSSFAGLFISMILTAVLIWKADRARHDYFFTGALDGSMILQFLLVCLMGYWGGR